MAKLTKANLKNGDKLKMKNDRFSSYGILKGDIVTIYSVTGSGSASITVDHLAYKGLNVGLTDVEYQCLTKALLEEEINECNKVIAENEAKLKWMKDTKSEVFDENEFKVWQVLSTLDSKASKIEKTRAIAKLINGA